MHLPNVLSRMKSAIALYPLKASSALTEEHSLEPATKQRSVKRQLEIGLCLCLSSALFAKNEDCAFAQIIPDTTLGNESSTITSVTSTVDQLDGGAIRGANLFHSFQEFNVGDGRSAYFTNPPEIENILTRVTGTNASNIFGTLGVTGGNANLFLINPNGIVFGENARLDVRGSFVATTANAIALANGDIFSTNPSDPLPNQLITVKPNAFFFNQIAPQPIINRSTANSRGLQVPQGRSLLLLGGEVRLEGGQLRASGGRIELGSVAGSGIVGLNVEGNNLRLSFPDSLARADVSLLNRSVVDASGQGGGSIQVQGRLVTLANESKVSANTLGNQNGGGISIEASQLSIQSGSQVSASTSGAGRAGNIDVNASEWVELSGTSEDGQKPSKIADDTEGAGVGGNLTITTPVLIVRDGSRISASTSGTAQGGTINVNASDSVQLIGTSPGDRRPSGLSVQTRGTTGANAGELNITTRALIVRDGAEVSAATFGEGAGGTVTVNASELVEVIGTSANGQLRSTLIAQNGGREVLQEGVSPPATGDGGSVIVQTRHLSVRNHAQVTVSSEDLGKAGNLTVTADSIFLDNQGKLLGETASGLGGNIRLQVQDLIVMRNESAIATTAKNNGNGGNISINAPLIIGIPTENTDIVADAEQGIGGGIDIRATGIYGLQFRDVRTVLSDINASSRAEGKDGTVEINTPDVDPSQGVTNLPRNLVDVSNQIAQNCSVGTQVAQSRFFLTGRGGLPPNPSEPLSNDTVWTDLRLTSRAMARIGEWDSGSKNSPSLPFTEPPRQIMEATGWVRGSNGEIILTAHAPNVTFHSSWQTPTKCHVQ